MKQSLSDEYLALKYWGEKLEYVDTLEEEKNNWKEVLEERKNKEEELGEQQFESLREQEI